MDKLENKYDSNIIITKKLTATKWNLIEKPLTESERKRNEIILNLGEVSSTTNLVDYNKSNLIVIGEYYYLKIREKIEDILQLPSIDKKKINSVLNIKNKKIKITIENTKDRIDKKLVTLLSLLNDNLDNKLFTDLMTNSSNYIEFRIITLMKLIENIIKNKKPETDKEEILLGSKKIINILRTVIDKQNKDVNYCYFNKIFSISGYELNLSEQLVIDLDYKINLLADSCKLKLFDIANRRPKLIFDTKYDETIPDIKLKPYDSQIELARIVKDNIQNGFLLFYKTLPGLGKTSMILSICSFIKKSNSKLKVIFCCSDILESVRVQVLRTMFNFGIKIGTANANSTKNEYKITNSWYCKDDNERELIVADYKSTYLILKEEEEKIDEKNKIKYLVFFDEPTILTDKLENSVTLEFLSKIFYWIPKHIILSSATLPLLQELEEIIIHYKKKYNDGVVKEIVSNKTLVGCFIQDFNSNVIVPHSYCKNTTDLKDLLLKIKTFPLLGKFYTLPFLMNLNEYSKKFNFHINLDQIESFDQESILENILYLLDKICNLEKQEDFDEFKKINIVKISDEAFNENIVNESLNTIDPSKILTSHAAKYLGCCLIATQDPLKYVTQHLYPIVEKLKEKIKIKSIHKNYEDYLKEKNKYKSLEEEILNKYNSDEKREEHLLKLKVPKFEFHKNLEINTEEHIKIFSKNLKSYDKSMLKNCVSHENINITEYNIDDNLKFLLYMGVGVYTQNIDSDYSTKILEMLNDRELAFIIADESFCYGANYEISNVIINDDLANGHSINTILQLIGRTSRIGKSWSGKVYMDTNTCVRLIEFFKNPSFNSNEGTNISNSFKKIREKIIEEKIEEEIKIKMESEMKLKKIKENHIKELKKLQEQKQEEDLKIQNDFKLFEDEEFQYWRKKKASNEPEKELFKFKSSLENENDTNKQNVVEDWGSIRKKNVIIENDTNKQQLNIQNSKNLVNELNKDANVNVNINVNENINIIEDWGSIRKKKNVIIENETNKPQLNIVDKNSVNEINNVNNINSNLFTWGQSNRKSDREIKHNDVFAKIFSIDSNENNNNIEYIKPSNLNKTPDDDDDWLKIKKNKKN